MRKKQQRQVGIQEKRDVPEGPVSPNAIGPKLREKRGKSIGGRMPSLGGRGHPSLSTELVLCGMTRGGELELREAENLLSHMTAEWQPPTAPPS